MLDHNYDEPFEFNQEDYYVEPQNEVLFSKQVNDIHKNATPPYIMTVDLEEGKSAKLEVYFDSNPTKLAFEFCKAYNLDFEAMQFLTDEIARLVSSKEIQAQKSPISEMPECIQEVDEDINSELYRSQMDLSKQRSDNSKGKEGPSPIKAPLSDKSSMTAFTNIDINKTKNISNNNLSNIHNNSISSISKPNISRSSKDFQGNQPLDIKQFSYQLFLDKSTNSGDIGVLLKNAAHSKNNSQSNSNNQSGRTTSAKSNIFDKLYNDSKIRKSINLHKSRPPLPGSEKISGTVQNNNVTKITKEKKESSEKINYGERLYIKGLKIKEETSTKIEKLKAEREVTEKQIYTFKPKFIENYYSDSVDLIKARLNNHNEEILHYQKVKDEKIEKLRKKHRKDETYSFSPEINKNTDSFLKTKGFHYDSETGDLKASYFKPSDIDERCRQRFMKIQKLEKNIYNFSHIPMTNKTPEISLNFEERQDRFQKRVREHSEEIKNKEFYDSRTGQQLFSPKRETSKTNKIIEGRVKERENLTDYLYSYSQKFNVKRESLTKFYTQNLSKNSQASSYSNSSDKIINTMKKEAFNKLFNLLDINGEQAISNYNLQKKNIPQEIQTILTPLFNKIKIENCKIEKDEFFECCEEIFASISHDKKNQMLKFARPTLARNKSQGDKFSFKPKINSRKRNVFSLEKRSLNNSTSASSMNHLRKVHNNLNYQTSSNNLISSENMTEAAN